MNLNLKQVNKLKIKTNITAISLASCLFITLTSLNVECAPQSTKSIEKRKDGIVTNNSGVKTAPRRPDPVQRLVTASDLLPSLKNNSPVFPVDENSDNSQIVFVNFDRVVLDNENSTQRQSINQDYIKRDASITCGETNRNGLSSLEKTDADLFNRIVGGKKAEPGEYPFQVRLNIRSRRGSSMCGGVVIDRNHILTAAHCTTTCSSFFMTSTVEPSAVKATIGDYKINSADGEQVISISSVKAHERYSACSYSHNNYDIALLRTSKPMEWKFSKDGFGSVNRICLPKKNTDYNVGDNVTVSGWGVMSEDAGSISNTLNSVSLPIVSFTDCKDTYGHRVNKDHVCAGFVKGGKDSCQGDSGGPLIRQKDGISELVGIVSFGVGCARESYPGVYTKVSHYIDWIKDNL